MIDMHSHILPGVDDGAEFFDEAREMVDIAVANGTEALVLTPHYILRYHGPAFPAEELRERFNIFSEKIRRAYPALSLHFGAENFISEHLLQSLSKETLIPLDDTNYILTEFDFFEQAYTAEYGVDKLLEMGYRPILAHPERYHFFYQKTELLSRFAQKGCLFQMNAGSPSGFYGPQAEELSYWMLRHELVHCVGSDAHSPYQRTPDMSDAYAFVSLHFSREYSNRIFRDNPRAILAGAAVSAKEEEHL